MRLLVVTPSLGSCPMFRETVASIGATGVIHSHVVVAPVAAHAALRKQYSRLHLVGDPGGGMYAALNTGIESAVTEAWDWFTYLNDDDRWDAAGMHIACTLAAADDFAADVLYGRVALIRENGALAGELPVARRPADLRALLVRGLVPFAQPGMLVRRGLLEKLGGFDASYRSAGDLDLCIRALESGAHFAYVPHQIAAFRLRTGQLSKNASVVRTETARALAPLQRGPTSGTRAALLRFRAGNLGVYLDRFRHHGWSRMSDVYRKA